MLFRKSFTLLILGKEENPMRKLKNVLLVSALALSAVTATVTIAETVDVEGGTWSYGYTTGINAYSDYYHSYNYHGSRVKNRNNGDTNTANAESGVWSKAWIWDVWDPATFYYSSNGGY